MKIVTDGRRGKKERNFGRSGGGLSCGGLSCGGLSCGRLSVGGLSSGGRGPPEGGSNGRVHRKWVQGSGFRVQFRFLGTKTETEQKKKERKKKQSKHHLFDFGQLISTSANFDFGQFRLRPAARSGIVRSRIGRSRASSFETPRRSDPMNLFSIQSQSCAKNVIFDSELKFVLHTPHRLEQIYNLQKQ